MIFSRSFLYRVDIFRFISNIKCDVHLLRQKFKKYRGKKEILILKEILKVDNLYL